MIFLLETHFFPPSYHFFHPVTIFCRQVTFLLPSPRPHHCQNLYVEDDQVNFLCPSPRPHHCQDLYVEDDQVTFLCPSPHRCQQQAAQEIEDSASRLFAH